MLAAAVVFAAALGGAIALFGIALTPDRFLLVLLAPAVVVKRARRYLVDFIPFALLIVLYADLRGLAHTVRPHPFYTPQLDAERWLFGGYVPSAVLQHWLFAGHLRLFDNAVVAITKVHSLVPTTLAFCLWLRRRALFLRFAATMLALSYAGALTFLVFPAAPPWAAASSGHVHGISRIGTSVSAPIPPDIAAPMLASAATPQPLLTLYAWIHGNPYAAIPSLHAGYSFLVFLFVATLAWPTRFRWWAVGLGAVYPLLQSFAAVYTGNHYVVDLLIGDAFAAAALFGVRALWRRRGLPE